MQPYNYGPLGGSRVATQQKTFPEDIQLVIEPDRQQGLGAVFISNKEAAENIRTLKRHGIGAVLTAARGIQLNHSRTDIPLYKYIPAVDTESFNLAPFFDDAGRFIEEARRKTNVLVHCVAGVSRSASLVIAYLMRKKGLGYYSAFSAVKSKRPIINPNSGFIDQLKGYETAAPERVSSPARAEYRPQNYYYSPRGAVSSHESAKQDHSFKRWDQPRFKEAWETGGRASAEWQMSSRIQSRPSAFGGRDLTPKTGSRLPGKEGRLFSPRHRRTQERFYPSQYYN